jgi:hypothetical protein
VHACRWFDLYAFLSCHSLVPFPRAISSCSKWYDVTCRSGTLPGSHRTRQGRIGKEEADGEGLRIPDVAEPLTVTPSPFAARSLPRGHLPPPSRAQQHRAYASTPRHPPLDVFLPFHVCLLPPKTPAGTSRLVVASSPPCRRPDPFGLFPSLPAAVPPCPSRGPAHECSACRPRYVP